MASICFSLGCGSDSKSNIDPQPASSAPYAIAGRGLSDPWDQMLARSNERGQKVNDEDTVLASAFEPTYLAIDRAGENIYASDTSRHRIVRVNIATGDMVTVAGSGRAGSAGDGGPATEARLLFPYGVGVGPDDSIYIADINNGRFRKVGPDGIINTIATSSKPLDIGVADNGDVFLLDRPGTQARVQRLRNGVLTTLWESAPNSGVLAFDVTPEGVVYVPMMFDRRVLKIDTDGTVSPFAGDGRDVLSGDEGPALAAGFRRIIDVYEAPDGNVYMNDIFERVIRRVDTNGIIHAFAGDRTKRSFGGAGDGGPAVQGMFRTPRGMVVDKDGNFYVADPDDHRIRRIKPNGIIDTFIGLSDLDPAADGTPARQVIITPAGVAEHPITKEIYFADSYYSRVRRIDAQGNVFTVAGSSNCNPPLGNGFAGDNGPALEACLAYPKAIAFGPTGVLYIADTQNNRVRSVDSDGIIRTVLGGGDHTDAGDGGPAVGASVTRPYDVVVDSQGNIYVSDITNHVIRRVDTNGIVTRFAGTGAYGRNRLEGIADQIPLTLAFGLAVGSDDTLYFADVQNNLLRAVSPDGMMRTIAGTGQSYGTRFAEGPALSTVVYFPVALTVDRNDHVYFQSYYSGFIHRVVDGQIEIVAGTGRHPWDSSSDDEGLRIGRIDDMIMTSGQTLVFSEQDLSRIRAIDFSPPAPACLLDVDGDSMPRAQRDAAWLFRYYSGLDPIVPDSLREDAMVPEDEVLANIEAIWNSLDLDGDGTVEPFVDLLAVYLYLNGAEDLVLAAFEDAFNAEGDSNEIVRAQLEALCPL